MPNLSCLFSRSCATALALAVALGGQAALAQGTLRIGMTAADVPLTTGQTDQGGEGMRFMGYTVYDGLINWDLSSADKPSGLVPGLATSWKVDEGDNTRWVITLRRDVKFHDGSDFKADAVVWNFDKILNDKSPQYDPKQAAQSRQRVPTLVGWKAIDKQTVELTTRVANALFPYDMSYIFYSSPAQWEKLGKDWVKVALQPSGTGPFKVDRVVPRERMELSRFDGYWDKARVPKLDKVLLYRFDQGLDQENVPLAAVGLKLDLQTVVGEAGDLARLQRGPELFADLPGEFRMGAAAEDGDVSHGSIVAHGPRRRFFPASVPAWAMTRS